MHKEDLAGADVKEILQEMRSKIDDLEKVTNNIMQGSEVSVQLPRNQLLVFNHLAKSEENTTCMRNVSSFTGISLPSVRCALSALIQKGYLADITTIRTSHFQGFSYKVLKPR